MPGSHQPSLLNGSEWVSEWVREWVSDKHSQWSDSGPIRCFIFVFHEKHRKYHEYPEYWVQCEILEQRYWYQFCIEWKLCWKDGTVNISWLVEIFLTICCLITARLFWNVVTKSSQRQDGHCLKWNNFYKRWWWRQWSKDHCAYHEITNVGKHTHSNIHTRHVKLVKVVPMIKVKGRTQVTFVGYGARDRD